MKRLRDLNRFRDRQAERDRCAQFGVAYDPVTFSQDTGGVFKLPSPQDGASLRVIASTGEGWDHVSISRPLRPPSWTEMEHVKRLFFRPDEVAMQLHVPPADHINLATTCLHLWRPHVAVIPVPPKWMV